MSPDTDASGLSQQDSHVAEASHRDLDHWLNTGLSAESQRRESLKIDLLFDEQISVAIDRVVDNDVDSPAS